MKTKVRKHVRKVGNRFVLVKKHNRKINKKTRLFSKHKGKAIISKKKRKVLDDMFNRDFELGGYLDFEKGKGLENMKIHYGSKYALEFDDDPDYETQIHSHPNIKGVSIMPSYEDIVGMQETNQKEQLIFTRGLAISIAEKDRFRHVSPKRIRQVSNMMQRDFVNGMKDRKMYEKYKSIFRRELGLSMRWHDPNKDIILETRAV